MIVFSKNILSLFLYVSIIGEMIFFPSIENLYGCLIVFICYKIFIEYFFYREIILKAPFAFMMFLSMFLYRYLSLIATFCEWKPITYGLELPYYTFSLELLLFIISCLAFYFSLSKKESNNILQKIFFKIGLFKRYSSSVIWILGFIGLASRIFTLMTNIEFGDIYEKAIEGLVFLMYIPFVLLFPSLLNCIIQSPKILFANIKNENDNIIKHTVNNPNINRIRIIYVLFYACIIFIINIATNSREGLIAPIALMILLSFLNSVNIHFNSRNTYSYPKILFTILIIIILFNVLNRFSV